MTTTSALTLGAFTDEISSFLDVQISHCVANGIRYFELRAVNNTNVLDLDDAMLREIKTKLDDHGLSVISIGSPIGKVRIDEDFGPHLDRFKHAADVAEALGAPLIRIFSYYPATNETHADLVARHRNEVMLRLQAKADYMTGRAPMLVHENEAQIFGEKAAQCLDIMLSINSPKLKLAFDFANFVQAKEDTLAAWQVLKRHVIHFHVKDAQGTDGKIVPPGQGDGHITEILKDAWAGGYRGTLTLEPHLSAAGQFSGFSGTALFKVAADDLKAICAAAGIPLSLR